VLFYLLALVPGTAWIVATAVAMLRLREEPVDAPVGARAQIDSNRCIRLFFICRYFRGRRPNLPGLSA